MTDMIKRVTEAIEDNIKFGKTWSDGHTYANGFEAASRAAIKAMREPTKEMLKSAGTIEGYEGRVYRSANEDHVNWWQAMIDSI